MSFVKHRIYGCIAVLGCAGVLSGSSACSSDAVRATSRDAGAAVDTRPVGSSDVEVGATPAVLPDAGDAPRVIAPFHVVGRFDARDPAGPRFGWAGTQVRARFAGSALQIELADSGVSHYDVAIDGAAPTLLVVAGAKKTYDVATGLAPGAHELVLTKRTETFTGVTQLFGFVGELIPSPAPNGRHIELVGDSITCGFGVLGPDETCEFSAATEAEPLAWGALAAFELGALRMVTAVSGMGVLRNYDGSTTDTMPDRYDRSLADDATSTWSHQAFEPDVIVVNLGTNDFAGGKGDPGPGFQTAYTKLLADLRARHPSAHIVVATSPMLSGENRANHRAYVENSTVARQSAGDTKISLLDIEVQSDLDGYGCAYHPSITTQQKMATKLVEHVKSLMGW